MPVYLKIGFEPSNVNRVTSKAFYVYRIRNVIYRKWGAISMEGRNVKKIRWEKGYPQGKIDNLNSIEAAVEFVRVSKLRILAKGYHKSEVRISDIYSNTK